MAGKDIQTAARYEEREAGRLTRSLVGCVEASPLTARPAVFADGSSIRGVGDVFLADEHMGRNRSVVKASRSER